MNIYSPDDTIAAPATPGGVGAIGVIRVSGPQTFYILDGIFSGKKLTKAASHTIHFGRIRDGKKEIDEVLVSVFKAPSSYTGQDTAEISSHGSPFIQQLILDLLNRKGIRMASPGEFTLRAFLNGKLDLSQAEAVADMIAADSEGALKTALQQMRGGFSEEIKELRKELVHFASLVELELDFSEEDVEFADRQQLSELIVKIKDTVLRLIKSFRYGNVIKNGYPTVIAGKPNAGKSTLLNALLNEERAIVSDIAGTTRDTVEEAIQIKGITFRFVDTAGLRTDGVSEIEKIGIGKALEKIKSAAVLLYIFDAEKTLPEEVEEELLKLDAGQARVLRIANKADRCTAEEKKKLRESGVLVISARETDIGELLEALEAIASEAEIGQDQTVISNMRHLEALQQTEQALNAALAGLESGLSGDLLAEDIRRALYHLGEITGEITTDDLLDNIFSKFCIGK
jgi:tRNA modification GTPase